MPPSKPLQEFVALDALRGCAALAVVTLHTRMLFDWDQHITAYLAVDLFFILSGFVLCHAYDRRLERGLTVYRFMLIRLIRLYPLYLVAMAIALTVVVLDADKSPFGFGTIVGIAAREMVFIPSFARGPDNDAFYLVTPAWSLTFELFVNLVYALTQRWLSIGRLCVICAVSGIGFVAVMAHYRSLDVGWDARTFPAGFVRVTVSFFAGVLLYKVGRPFAATRWFGAHALACALLLAVLTAILFSSATGVAHAVFNLACIFLVFPAMIFFGARLAPSGWSARLFEMAGIASYAVYVIHVPLRNLLGFLMEGSALQPSFWLGSAFMIGVVVGALILDAVYDRPVRRWLSARLGRPHRAVPEGTRGTAATERAGQSAMTSPTPAD